MGEAPSSLPPKISLLLIFASRKTSFQVETPNHVRTPVNLFSSSDIFPSVSNVPPQRSLSSIGTNSY